jgi:hypothetical protein
LLQRLYINFYEGGKIMMNGYDGLSPSDVALLSRNNDNGGFGGDGWLAILLLLVLGGFGGGFGFGGMGGFGGGFGMYPWIANGQQGIIANTNTGFDTLHLSNQLDTINSGIYSLSNQLCNCCADMNQTVSNGFYNSEISANNRQMANMNQNFNNQIATLNGFNGLQKSLDNCCCENRLATCQTQNIVQNEGNATRFADANNTRDIITNATANTQAILDKLCQLELDGVKAQVEAKNDRIAELQGQLQMADLRASQTAQNAFISQGFANEVDQLYNRLNSCPVPSTPVYGRTPIFTCNNNGCGCGCGNNNLF